MATVWTSCLKEDWCHICGMKDVPMAEVLYPINAGYQIMSSMPINGGEDFKHIRVCADCAETILRVARSLKSRSTSDKKGEVHGH